MPATVNELLSRAPGKLWTVVPGDTVFRALQVMANAQVGALAVLEKGRVAGLVTERDVARKVELAGRTARETTVGEIMTKDVATVEPDCAIDECLALMAARRLQYVPVLSGGQLSGVVDWSDLFAARSGPPARPAARP